MLLAGRGELEAEAAEQAVRDTGAELTVVRATWFAQNFSEDYMLDYVLSGVVALPGGDTPEPFVDADDIADVAVAALTEDWPRRRALRADRPAAADLRGGGRGDLRKRPAGRSATSRSRSRSTLPLPPRMACPAEVIDLLTYLFSEILDGRNARLADGVQRALGREPKDFADYARDAAAIRRLDRHADGRGCLFALTLVTALGCGVIAGVFFAFSTFVMRCSAPSSAGAGHRRDAVDQRSRQPA